MDIDLLNVTWKRILKGFKKESIMDSWKHVGGTVWVDTATHIGGFPVRDFIGYTYNTATTATTWGATTWA